MQAVLDPAVILKTSRFAGECCMLITYELDPLPFLSGRKQCSSQSTWRTKLQKGKKKKKSTLGSFPVLKGQIEASEKEWERGKRQRSKRR